MGLQMVFVFMVISFFSYRNLADMGRLLKLYHNSLKKTIGCLKFGISGDWDNGIRGLRVLPQLGFFEKNAFSRNIFFQTS
jgi:hypothetical protein